LYKTCAGKESHVKLTIQQNFKKYI